VHLEFRDSTDHLNYHERRKSALMNKRKIFRHLVVDGVGGGGGTTPRGGAKQQNYATISEALEEAEDGDEIHVYPKADGSSYKERVVVDKNVHIKGMKNVFGEAEGAGLLDVVDADSAGGRGRSTTRKGSQSPKAAGRKSSKGRSSRERQLTGNSILDAAASQGVLKVEQQSTGKVLNDMVQNLKDEQRLDEAREERQAHEAMMKSKGEKVEKKYVVIEYSDSTEEEAVVRSCAQNVNLTNITVQHSGQNSLACLFVAFGTLTCQQVRCYSEGGDGVYVTQGGQMVAKQGCHFGPCKRNGLLVEGLCSKVDVVDCEIRGNSQCGVKAIGGAEVVLKRNRINANDLHGVSIGTKCPADLLQNAFEHNGEMHLFIKAKWFLVDKDMINVSNSDQDDAESCKVSSRLNTIKSTQTWSKGRRYERASEASVKKVLRARGAPRFRHRRATAGEDEIATPTHSTLHSPRFCRYSLHGTQAFMDVLATDD
jgi:hypothetical protein